MATPACVGTQSEALSSSMNALTTEGKRLPIALFLSGRKPYLHADWTFMCISEWWLRIGALVDVNRRDIEIRDEKVASEKEEAEKHAVQMSTSSRSITYLWEERCVPS